MTWDGTYPVRARIIDPEGFSVPGLPPEIVASTPPVSKPHVGKEGLAEKVEAVGPPPFNHVIRIRLDDGNVLYGHECWWEPLA